MASHVSADRGQIHFGTKSLVDDLSFAGPRVAYLRSGFGGNPWGSGFHIDRFRLIGADDTTPADAEAVALRQPPPGPR